MATAIERAAPPPLPWQGADEIERARSQSGHYDSRSPSAAGASHSSISQASASSSSVAAFAIPSQTERSIYRPNAQDLTLKSLPAQRWVQSAPQPPNTTSLTSYGRFAPWAGQNGSPFGPPTDTLTITPSSRLGQNPPLHDAFAVLASKPRPSRKPRPIMPVIQSNDVPSERIVWPPPDRVSQRQREHDQRMLNALSMTPTPTPPPITRLPGAPLYDGSLSDDDSRPGSSATGSRPVSPTESKLKVLTGNGLDDVFSLRSLPPLVSLPGRRLQLPERTNSDLTVTDSAASAGRPRSAPLVRTNSAKQRMAMDELLMVTPDGLWDLRGRRVEDIFGAPSPSPSSPFSPSDRGEPAKKRARSLSIMWAQDGSGKERCSPLFEEDAEDCTSDSSVHERETVCGRAPEIKVGVLGKKERVKNWAGSVPEGKSSANLPPTPPAGLLLGVVS